MTDERLDQIDRLTRRPDAHGFRSECVELVAEVRRLREANDGMRSLVVANDWGPLLIADTLDRAARRFDSSLHEAAALMIRRLMRDVAEAGDTAADAKA